MKMKNRCRNITLILALCFAILLTATSVQANSVPPPPSIWIRFFIKNFVTPKIFGVQILGCEEESCINPVYLKGNGTCNAQECITTQPLLTEESTLDCISNRCLFRLGYYDAEYIPAFIKFIVSSDAGIVVTSTNPFPQCFGCSHYWKVDLSEETHEITDDNDAASINLSIYNYLLVFIFSLFVELAISAFILFFGLKKSKQFIKRTFIQVILANCISSPIVWLIIPAFGQLTTASGRNTGIVLLIECIILTLMILWASKNKVGMKKKLLTAILIIIPICLLLCLFAYCLYEMLKYPKMYVNGLSYSSQIALSEFFAIGFETWFIYTFMKKEISLKVVAILCFVMNVSSYILGKIIF
jgi:hypothetical protein